MKLIVTRPLEDAQPLGDKLAALGHEPVNLPLLEIVRREGVTIPPLPFQAVAASSANGLLHAEAIEPLLHLPLFVVGPQSAAMARRRGFIHVHDKGGTVEGLVREIVKCQKPADGPVLYLSGAETSGDLEGKLKALGFEVLRLIVYDARPARVADLASRLADADGVLLYSPRSAKIWLDVLSDGQALARAATLRHFCLSANVAAVLPKTFIRKIAARPDEGGMLALLEQAGEEE